jgi:hypothetical protein
MELLLTLITSLVFVFFTACFIRFAHYCIGEPNGEDYQVGRIFSFWGRFVSQGYVRAWNNETNRLWAKYEAWKAKKDAELMEVLKVAVNAERVRLTKKFNAEVEEKQNDIENHRRSMIWSALGACLVCFGTWIAMVLWGFFILLGVPVWVFIFGVTASVMVAVRL